MSAARSACQAALLCLGGAMLGAASYAPAMRDAPPTAVTGGFGEATCQMCHFDADVNAAAGSLALAGVPETYTPGETYTLTLTLVHDSVAAGGFEIAARFDPSAKQAGSLASLPDQNDRIAVTTEAGVQYAHHLRPGSNTAAPDTVRWSILWTAPPGDGGPVIFHAVSNAANGDDSPLGDFVYATTQTTRPRS